MITVDNGAGYSFVWEGRNTTVFGPALIDKRGRVVYMPPDQRLNLDTMEMMYDSDYWAVEARESGGSGERAGGDGEAGGGTESEN